MTWLFIRREDKPRRDRALINLVHVAQVRVAESTGTDVFKIIAVASDAESWEVLTDLSEEQAMEAMDHLAASLGARDNLILRGGGEGGAYIGTVPRRG